jgi:hypothetical protein
MKSIPYYNIEKQMPSLFSEILPLWNKSKDFVKNIVLMFDEKKRMFPPQSEQIHLVGTQDTANMVDTIQKHLIREIGNHAISSEIVLYKESAQ